MKSTLITPEHQKLFEKAKDLEKEYEAKGALISHLEDEVAYYNETLDDIATEIALADSAKEVFEEIKDSLGQVGLEDIERVVNRVLSALPFPVDYVFRFEKQGATELVPTVYDPKAQQYRRMQKQSGTALRQVISCILSMMIISLNGNSRILLIDEKLSGFDDDSMFTAFYEVLIELAEAMDFQIICIEQKSKIFELEGINEILVHFDEDELELNLVDIRETV